MNRWQHPIRLAIFAGTLATACVHGGVDSPAPAPNPDFAPAPALPGEMRAVGNSGTMIVREPCAQESQTGSSDERQPQVELGLAFWRPGQSAKPAVVPYAAFRCSGH